MNIFLTWDSSGIGKFVYEKLSKKYNVFWVSRTGQYKFDLTKKEEIEKLTYKFKDNQFDVLVLNAWIWYFWKFKDGDIETYEKIMNLNLFANIELLQKLNYTEKVKIIFIWSIISKKFMKWATVYQASKFGLRGFAWWLKQEWYRVHIINPKIVDTNFHPQNMNLSQFPQTKLEDIYQVIENIIDWKEKRFEIDL